MKVAIFDFDGTLTRKDTFIEFGRYAVGISNFLCALFLSAPYLIAWKCRIISSSKAKEHLFSCLFKGMDYKRFAELGQEFAMQIDTMLRDDGMQLLRKHQYDGADCYIISASIAEWIEPWAKCNGIKEIAATMVEVDDSGRLTGRFYGKNCLGQEKVCRLESLIPNYLQYETWAYGDSDSDKPLLNVVKHGIMLTKLKNSNRR